MNTGQRFSFSFLNFNKVLQNETPEKLINICRIERDGIKAIEFEAAQIHFLSDVIVAVAVVVTSVPY